MSIFNPISKEKQAFLLASHLPEGKAWNKAFVYDDDFGNLFFGLAIEFYRFQVLEQKLFNEMDINLADELLLEWEQSVGIPDTCFSVTVSETQRRLQVEQKFGKYGGVQTKEDFIRVAAIFGFEIDIELRKTEGQFALEFPAVFFSSQKAAIYTMFIEIISDEDITTDFPLIFPIPFSTGGREFLSCIFDKLAPANVNVVIINEGDLE